MPPQLCGSDGGALYALLGTSIAAVRTGDGAILWRSAPLWPSSPRPSPLTYALRCVAQDGGVYTEVGGGSDADPRALIKLSERDGTQRWNVPVVSLISVAGDRLYATRNTVGLVKPRLVVLRASDGVQLGAPLEMLIDALQAPYSASSAGVLYLVGRSTSPPAAYTSAPCEIFAIRLRDGARLWQRPPHACDYPQALRVAGGTLYYTTNDGDLTAFRIADGGCSGRTPATVARGCIGIRRIRTPSARSAPECFSSTRVMRSPASSSWWGATPTMGSISRRSIRRPECSTGATARIRAPAISCLPGHNAGAGHEV